MHSIGLDAHKRYSQFEVLDPMATTISKGRIQHERGALKEFFSQFPPGTPIALETVGNWYWIADEIEAAGCLPRLAHAAKAKVMMGNVNKTDKIDAHGLAILQHNNTLPGIGDILSIVIDREVGDISRFSHSDSFAAYCGTTPRVSGSGGKFHYGHLRKESNQYLQFAFIEAANVIVAHHRRINWQNRHVVRLYERVRARRGSAVAVGAVARHLSESAFWILTKMEPYREPSPHPKRARA